MKRKVWVVKPLDNVELAPVWQFGTVTFMMDKHVWPLNVRQQQSEIRHHVFAMADANDLILVAGPSTMVAVASAMFMQKFGKVNLLLFKRQGEYYEQTVE